MSRISEGDETFLKGMFWIQDEMFRRWRKPVYQDVASIANRLADPSTDWHQRVYGVVRDEWEEEDEGVALNIYKYPVVIHNTAMVRDDEEEDEEVIVYSPLISLGALCAVVCILGLVMWMIWG